MLELSDIPEHCQHLWAYSLTTAPPPAPRCPRSHGGSLAHERAANARNTSQHLSPSPARQPKCTKSFSYVHHPAWVSQQLYDAGVISSLYR